MHVGSYLRSVRESRHLTIAQVSRRTKIHSSLLVDLENNDLSHWPIHRIYRHGHLRSYANAVGLEAEAVLRQFDDEVGDPHPAPFQGPPRPVRTPRHPATAGRGLMLSSAVVAIGILAIYFHDAGNNFLATPPASAVAAANEHTTPASVSTPASPSEAASVTLMSVDEPEPKVEVEGQLQIVSTPAGAHVTVNDIGRGETPVRVRFLIPGQYTIRVIEPGYRIAQTVVTISRERPRQTVRLELREAPSSMILTASGSTR